MKKEAVKELKKEATKEIKKEASKELKKEATKESEKEAVKKTKRMANIELLRILAMMMVIMLHFLSKGQVLPSLTEPLSGNGYAAWILESLCIVAVNVYMLISGFFLVESGFKCRRLVQLICQVLFYSILIPVILISAGMLPVSGLTLYTLLQYFLPVEMEHYWFVTAYVMMYLFSPLLGAAVKAMKQNQLKYTIIILLLYLSVNKSVLPVHLTIDRQGYDGVWFLCVYLVAAYMRLYGIPFLKSRARSWWCYLGSCAGIFGIALLLHAVYMRTGKLEDFLGATYHYNHILNLMAAVSLFYAFYYWKPGEGHASRVICRIAPYTFGVYLLHEQLEIRYLWPQWLGASAEGNAVSFVLRAAASVLAVFIIGIAVDMLRGWLFHMAGILLKRSRINIALEEIDDRIAGRK